MLYWQFYQYISCLSKVSSETFTKWGVNLAVWRLRKALNVLHETHASLDVSSNQRDATRQERLLDNTIAHSSRVWLSVARKVRRMRIAACLARNDHDYGYAEHLDRKINEIEPLLRLLAQAIDQYETSPA